MHINIGAYISVLGSVQSALALEPDVRPDLSGLSRARMPLVVLALLNRGTSDVEGIHDYLRDHGARFSRDEVADVIDEYESMGFDSDGLPTGLWRRLDERSLRAELSVNWP